MGSGYYGEMIMGSHNNNVSSSSNSGPSSRRKKKNSNSANKPKQPQRGLGVAQLEKIRLHGQFGCSSISPGGSYIGHHNLNFSQIGLSNYREGPNMGWNYLNSNGYSHEIQYSRPDYMSRQFFSGQDAEDDRWNKNECGRSGSHDSRSSNTQQEVDLELRL